MAATIVNTGRRVRIRDRILRSAQAILRRLCPPSQGGRRVSRACQSISSEKSTMVTEASGTRLRISAVTSPRPDPDRFRVKLRPNYGQKENGFITVDTGRGSDSPGLHRPRRPGDRGAHWRRPLARILLYGWVACGSRVPGSGDRRAPFGHQQGRPRGRRALLGHQRAQLPGKNDPPEELLGGAGIQDLPHLPGQGRRREGLLQEFGLGFERTPVDDRVGGIA